MKVFLTGSTGFVGSHVARAYAAAGAELRLLTRATSKLAAIEGLAAEVVVGDLRQPEALRTALRGCDALVHVAADYRLWVRDPKEMYAANVDGTRELLRIAREEGVAKVVYTSSVATMGFKADGTIVDETTPVSLADMIGAYKRSKFMAEQEAIAAAQAGQHVMILNPTTPIGPGDAKPTPTGRIVVDFLNRKFPAYVDTGLNLVDVSEVARMHVVALERGTPGERYILGGENLTLKQILDRMSAITGLPSPTMKVPHAVAMAFAFFDETITGRLLGKEPRATVEAVRMGRKMMFASSAKAERELGFQVLPVYNAMRAAIEWFVAHGYAPPFAERVAMKTCPAIIAALPREVSALVKGLGVANASRPRGRLYATAMLWSRARGWARARAALAVRGGDGGDAGDGADLGGTGGRVRSGAAGRRDCARRRGDRRADRRAVRGAIRRVDGQVLVDERCDCERAREDAAARAHTTPSAVDMEAATVARLARRRIGLQFRAIKAISDEADFEMEGLARFCDRGRAVSRGGVCAACGAAAGAVEQGDCAWAQQRAGAARALTEAICAAS